MTTQTIALAQDSALALEGPQYVFEGDQPLFACVKQGVTTITNDATLQMWVYKGSTDKTATFTTGSMSATGNTAITKTFQNLVGGDDLFVTLQGTCDGLLITFGAFRLHVNKRSGK